MSARMALRVSILSLAMAACMVPACSDPPAGPSGQGTSLMALSIRQVVPDSGPTESAVRVTVIGTGFRTNASVTIDGVLAQATVSSPTTIIATAPPHAEGPVDITVTNPDGEHASRAAAYRYELVSVTSVTPLAGLSGDAVAIRGTGIIPGATVTFGGVRGIVTSAAGSAIMAVVPSREPGPADVVVTNPGGQSAVLEGGFRYQTVTVTAGASTVTAGGGLDVSWVAPVGRSRFDWIGVIRAGDPAGSCDHGWWHYVDGAPSGSVAAFAPAQPGQYEFRYFVSDGCMEAARSNPFTVTAAASSAAFQSTRRGRGAGR